MIQTLKSLLASSACLATIALANSLPADEKRPNIVVILADDFGVGDIQAHYPDNKIPTPYLDRLVSQGMSFTDAHSPSAVCSPTRYGFLTGRYAWRTRLQEWVIAAYEPPLVAKDRLTLPGFLQQNGYHTACVGKWHLGWNWPGPQAGKMMEQRNGQRHLEWNFTQPIGGGPVDRGFDYFFGLGLPNLPPFTFIENDRIVTQPTEKYKYHPDQGQVMPRGSEGCPIAPNWKFDEILPELTRRAVAKIKERAKNDEPFFLFFSMTSPHEPIVPSKNFRDKSGIAPIADFVMETDFSAGQVIQAIDEAGIGDNTIVIFTADNGHSHYTGWEKLIEAGHWPSGQFRGHKGDIWEGGHRVPFIVRWPGRVAANSTSDQMVCLTDIFATVAEQIGVDVTDGAAEDSFSFLSAATGNAADATLNRTFDINHSRDGEFAFRDGAWKLVFRLSGKNLNESRGEPTVVELYNLAEDFSEKQNLVESRPEFVERMTAQLTDLIDRGASRPGQTGSNDTDVRFKTTQQIRWAAAGK